jgi:hypothetical protein
MVVLWLVAGSLTAEPLNRVTPLAGEVEFQLGPDAAFTRLDRAQDLPAAATVRTGVAGLAAIEYPDGTRITVKPGSVVQVGSGAGEGLWVQLGAVLVRVQRLMGAEQRVRTPVAVAAVRGTEFGVFVADDAATRVYVFDGTVAVTNVRLLDREVLVRPGEMTVVEPLRPPSAPAPFQADEFDRLGGLGSLERAEDRVLEASEEPAVESYLAFADPDIDMVRNPAHLGQRRYSSSTSVLAAHGAASHTWRDLGAGPQDADRVAQRGLVAQNVTLLPLHQRYRLGWFVQGADNHDDVTKPIYPPFGLAAERWRLVTDQRLGEAQVAGAVDLAHAVAGIGAGHRYSRIVVEDTSLSAGTPRGRTATRSHRTRLQGGLLWPGGGQRSLAVGLTHDLLGSTTRSAALDKDLSGYSDLAELLLRDQGRLLRSSALLRLERVRTTEDVVDTSGPLYHEHLHVWAIKGGAGIGLTPSPAVLVGADLLGGFSRERATQYLPAGGQLEDERDHRYSASLHLGTQVRPVHRIVLSLDVTHVVERTSKDFAERPGTPRTERWQEVETRYSTDASTGLGFVRPGLLVQYYVSAQAAGRPLTHHLVCVKDLF